MKQDTRTMMIGVLKNLVKQALKRQGIEAQVLGFSKDYGYVKYRHMGKRGQWLVGTVKSETLFPDTGK